jgi:hypothetical protein
VWAGICGKICGTKIFVCVSFAMVILGRGGDILVICGLALYVRMFYDANR